MLLAQVDLRAIAAESKLDPLLLYSVALAESSRRVEALKVAPWPWTIRSAKYGPRYFDTLEQAREHLKELLAQGEQNIDVGLMQINLKYHKDKIEDPYLLLDPERNLALGARLLRQALNSTKDPIMAVGRYHSNDSVRAYLYGYRVWQIYHRLSDYFGRF